MHVLSSKLIQAKQFKIYAAIAGSVVFGILLMFVLGGEDSGVVMENKVETPIVDVTQAMEDKSYWMFKSEAELEKHKAKQEDLYKQIEEVRRDINQKLQPEQIDNIAYKKLEQKIADLELKLNSKEEHKSLFDEKLNSNQGPPGKPENVKNNLMPSNENNNFPPAEYYGGGQPQKMMTNDQMGLEQNGIINYNLSLNSIELKKAKKYSDNYIPAGSYVKAIILSGVDVAVGQTAQAHPKPVLLRLIDKGSLPNKFEGHLSQCRITGAAFGELSSERANIRIETLSCIQKNGQVIETDVDGYISGEDGKNGMRGNLVMRDYEMMQKGFLGGFLSGVGKGVSETYSTSAITPFGAVQTTDGKDIFKKGAAQGAGGAFDLIAKYNINRAEEYQPVIQISAGRVVNVIFNAGSNFGERKTHHKDKNNG
ncbi:MAG: TrbI/VirB10 family protein [Gammaproteobacteria bacterium]